MYFNVVCTVRFNINSIYELPTSPNYCCYTTLRKLKQMAQVMLRVLRAEHNIYRSDYF